MDQLACLVMVALGVHADCSRTELPTRRLSVFSGWALLYELISSYGSLV